MISQTVLVAFEDFGGLDAARAAAAVGRGLSAGSAGDGASDASVRTLQADLCPLQTPGGAVAHLGGPAAHAGGAGAHAGTPTAHLGGPAAHAGGAGAHAGTPTAHPGGPPGHDPAAFAAQLAALDFDARMRAARAVVVGGARLDEATLLGSATFEIATRARQAGVPAYGVTAANALSRFDARILDLQVVLEARDARALRRAGQKLAGIV